MKTTGWIISAFSFAFATSHAQTFFRKDIGGAKDDEAVTVREAPDGGYYLTGNTRSKGNGGADVYLVKVNANGKVLWEKTFGGANDDFGWGLRLMKNGDIVITGFSDSEGHGKDDVLVIRTDSRGNLKWKKYFGGPYDDRSWEVIETFDQKTVIVGEYAKADNKTNLDGWLLALNEQGDELWSSLFGWDKIDRCFSVAESADKGFIVSGFTNSKGAGDYDVYLIKTDPSGKELWHKTFGGPLFEVGHTVRLLGKAGYMVAGYSRSFKSNGKGDAYMIQTDLEGNILKEMSFGEEAEERTLTFTENGKGGFVLLGYAEITNSNWDAYLAEVDRNLNFVRSRKIGEPYLDTGGHNILRVGDDYVFTGYLNRTGADKNVYIIKTNFLQH